VSQGHPQTTRRARSSDEAAVWNLAAPTCPNEHGLVAAGIREQVFAGATTGQGETSTFIRFRELMSVRGNALLQLFLPGSNDGRVRSVVHLFSRADVSVWAHAASTLPSS